MTEPACGGDGAVEDGATERLAAGPAPKPVITAAGNQLMTALPVCLPFSPSCGRGVAEPRETAPPPLTALAREPRALRPGGGRCQAGAGGQRGRCGNCLQGARSEARRQRVWAAPRPRAGGPPAASEERRTRELSGVWTGCGSEVQWQGGRGSPQGDTSLDLQDGSAAETAGAGFQPPEAVRGPQRRRAAGHREPGKQAAHRAPAHVPGAAGVAAWGPRVQALPQREPTSSFLWGPGSPPVGLRTQPRCRAAPERPGSRCRQGD